MVTPRAVALALVLMPLNAYWVTKMEVVRYLGHPTTISLFFNVVFILTILIALNALVRRVWSNSRCSRESCSPPTSCSPSPPPSPGTT